MDRIRFESGDGSFEVSQEGGRIVSLLPGKGLPDVLHSDPVAAVLGGDRAWLAPELELFYEDRADLQSRIHPEDLDPGSWAVDQSAASVNLRQGFRGAVMTREITPLVRPIVPTALSWAGFRVVDAVRSDRDWSAWHIVMVPSPADIFVGSNDPVTYYPPAPKILDGSMRSEDTPPRWKLGFTPPSHGGVVLAAVGEPDPGPLVVLTAELPENGTYIDRPPRGEAGTAAQVYSSGGEGFCELEVHAPLETRRVESVVIGAWGSRKERLQFVRALV